MAAVQLASARANAPAGLRTTCRSCLRSWVLPCDGSTYLLMDLEARPCPFCESCTLCCASAADAPLEAARGPRRAA